MDQPQDPSHELALAPERLDRRIFVVHGLQVMLDEDLARLYGVDTRTLNQAVRRNTKRFPPDFMLVLTPEDVTNLTSHSVISSARHGGRRKNAHAFTEHGVAMLSSVLHSSRAVQINIAIMRAFARLRDAVTLHARIVQRLNELELKYEGMTQRYDGQFDRVFDALRELLKATEATFGHAPTSHAPSEPIK
jgi:hypothetical protein